MAQQQHIPAPPQLPANWDPLTRDIGYEYDKTTRTFRNGRFLNLNDSHGRWVYTECENPIRLGAPSPGPNWHPIIHKWGLQALDAAGFINEQPMRKVQFAPGRMAHLYSEDPIHPAFRRDRWRGITDLQWKCIRPALQIVTSIIDEPDTLRFFAGCCNRPLPQLWDDHVGYYCKFQIPPFIDDTEARRTWDATVEMRKYVHFVIEDFDTWMQRGESWDTTYGVTQPDAAFLGAPLQGAIPDDPALGGQTSWSSKITFPGTWLKPGIRKYSTTQRSEVAHSKFLNQTLGVSAVEDNRKILIHPRPALMRWIYSFATTILHEFTHAFVNAHYPKSILFPIEPYCGDDECNEVGWAMQQHVFGAGVSGQTYAIPPLSIEAEVDQTTAAPFGLFADEHWARFRYDTTVMKRLGGVVDYDKTHDTFPVHQTDTEKIFNKEFWEQRVSRFGGRELQLQRNDWGVRWKPNPVFLGFETERWGSFDRWTHPLGWNIGITPGGFDDP